MAGLQRSPRNIPLVHTNQLRCLYKGITKANHYCFELGRVSSRIIHIHEIGVCLCHRLCIIVGLPYFHCQIGTIQATVQKRTPYFLSVSIISSLLVRVSNSRSVVSSWYLKYLSKVIYCQVIGGNILGLPSLSALRFP